MAMLWPLMLLFWAGFPRSLPSRLEVNILGSPEECKNAEFVPGYNLGGEGFDIVTGERKGTYVIDVDTWKNANGSCTLSRNSYLGKMQKIPIAVKDWRTIPMCSMGVTSQMYDSSEALTKESTSSVTNNWKIGLELQKIGVELGGTHSRDTLDAMEKSKQDRYFFVRHSVKCDVYRYGLKTNPPLHHDFEESVKHLPSVYSIHTKQEFTNLIDQYGTHYIQQAILGGEIKALTSVRMCQASMAGLTETEVKDCLGVEISYTMALSSKVKAAYQHCQAKKEEIGHSMSFSSRFNDHKVKVSGGKIDGDVLFAGQSNLPAYSAWVSSLYTIPDVVQYNLKPLHTILKSDHPARVPLKEAVAAYIMKNALAKKCSESCQVGHKSSARDRCACVCNNNQNLRSNCCPTGKGLATLEVFGLYAKGLYGDYFTQTDGSVEVSYDKQNKRTKTIDNNDNPVWSERFNFGTIQINMANQLRFKVYDDDWFSVRELLGECSFDLHSGTEINSCMFKHGTLYFTYNVQCAPSLGGPQCQDYIPSPMNASLAKVFHSRNGVLVGETWPK